MVRWLFVMLLVPVFAVAQRVELRSQRAFPATVPAGNYSGITWLGGQRYAVVDDKSPTAGFYLMTIDTDSLTGDILHVQADTFLTSQLPNRDEEGICYVPQTNTVFISGEKDKEIIEYSMDGQLTGRKLNVPEVFLTAWPNGGFEALTFDAVNRCFWTTSENTLKADGQRPDIKHKIKNRLRLQSFDFDLQPLHQYWYESDLSSVSRLEGSSYLGVSGLAALDDGRLVVLEREVYMTPKKIGSLVDVRLYLVNPSNCQEGELLEKQLLTEFRTKINLTARSFANYEGVCVGPRLADGRQLLLLVCDSQNQYHGYLKDWFRTVVIDLR